MFRALLYVKSKPQWFVSLDGSKFIPVDQKPEAEDYIGVKKLFEPQQLKRTLVVYTRRHLINCGAILEGLDIDNRCNRCLAKMPSYRYNKCSLCESLPAGAYFAID